MAQSAEEALALGLPDEAIVTQLHLRKCPVYEEQVLAGIVLEGVCLWYERRVRAGGCSCLLCSWAGLAVRSLWWCCWLAGPRSFTYCDGGPSKPCLPESTPRFSSWSYGTTPMSISHSAYRSAGQSPRRAATDSPGLPPSSTRTRAAFEDSSIVGSGLRSITFSSCSGSSPRNSTRIFWHPWMLVFYTLCRAPQALNWQAWPRWPQTSTPPFPRAAAISGNAPAHFYPFLS